MPNRNEHWRQIRQLRSRPPGGAGHDPTRRSVFQAALAQSEELWEAAKVAGARSRALPLFYALSQGGRAVAAAWSPGNEWQPRGHGLTREEPKGIDGLQFVAEYAVAVTARAHGAFRMVAEATASELFVGYATVAELWASMPLWPGSRALLGGRPGCLRIQRVRPVQQPPSVVDLLSPRFGQIDIPPGAAPGVLRRYPTARGFKLAGTGPGGSHHRSSVVSFPDDTGAKRSLDDVAFADQTESRLPEVFHLRPAVGTGAGEPPSQLMTLWALLFAFSELTRYYPAHWVGALDDDRSEAAVLLDHGLELALDLVPRLMASALSLGPSRWEIRRLLSQRNQQMKPIPPPSPRPPSERFRQF